MVLDDGDDLDVVPDVGKGVDVVGLTMDADVVLVDGELDDDDVTFDVGEDFDVMERTAEVTYGTDVVPDAEEDFVIVEVTGRDVDRVPADESPTQETAASS